MELAIQRTQVIMIRLIHTEGENLFNASVARGSKNM